MRERSRAKDEVSQQIRDFRKEAGLTQTQLAKRASLSLDAITRLETGQRSPNLNTLFALAEALGVQAPELLGAARKEDDTPPAITRITRLLATQPPEVLKAVEVCAREIAEVAASSRSQCE